MEEEGFGPKNAFEARKYIRYLSKVGNLAEFEQWSIRSTGVEGYNRYFEDLLDGTSIEHLVRAERAKGSVYILDLMSYGFL